MTFAASTGIQLMDPDSGEKSWWLEENPGKIQVLCPGGSLDRGELSLST